jgi:hypothetical protein
MEQSWPPPAAARRLDPPDVQRADCTHRDHPISAPDRPLRRPQPQRPRSAVLPRAGSRGRMSGIPRPGTCGSGLPSASSKRRSWRTSSFTARCPLRASHTTRETGVERVLEAPIEDTIGDLGAVSGYRVLERATGLPRWRPGSAGPGADDDRDGCPIPRVLEHAVIEQSAHPISADRGHHRRYWRGVRLPRPRTCDWATAMASGKCRSPARPSGVNSIRICRSVVEQRVSAAVARKASPRSSGRS